VNFKFNLTAEFIRFNLILLALIPSSVNAQVTAGGLHTRVNGTTLGSCVSGNCLINGGTRAGSNLFYRFSQFDTRGPIGKIKIDTNHNQNIVIGVTNQAGTLLDKPLHLSSPGNLFWLSPGGIWLGPGVGFYNAANLLLSTTTGLRFGEHRFDVFATTLKNTSDLHGLPRFNLTHTKTDEPRLNELNEFNGSQPIILEGGLITVDQNLVLDASGGNLVSIANAATRLQAGSSILLTGHNLDLNKIVIVVGDSKNWGPIDLRSNVSISGQGSIQLDHTLMKGGNIAVTSGAISLSNSRLESPKGWIQLKTTNPPGASNQLNIFKSILDVEPHTLGDLNASVTLADFNSHNANDIPIPHIGLISNGAINIQESTLNASLELSWLQGQQPFFDKTIGQLSALSGIVILETKNGNINIHSSRIAADASNNLAGQMYLLADDENSTGGINIIDSNLSASYGMGQGLISFRSNDGIIISNSILNTSSNRYPVIDKKEFYTDEEYPTPTPYSFFGGHISLYNWSNTKPIVVESSQLFAIKNTEKGPLENNLLSSKIETLGNQIYEFGPGGKYKEKMHI
jgi:hypothetical protein